MTSHDALSAHVNLLWCAHGRVGGSEEYLVRQLAGLALVEPSTVGPPIECTLHLGQALADAREELRPMHQVVSSLNVDRRGTRMLVEHSLLARVTRNAGLVHHGGGTLPLIRPRVPTVLTIHDLQYLRFPHYFSTSRLNYLQAMVPRSAKAATVVVTPTAHVADDVARSFSIEREKILVVPHGVPTLSADDAEVERQRLQVGGDGPMIVYPAITHPHKGHLKLIEAVTNFLPDTRLVLIGGVGAAEDDVLAAITAAPHPDQIMRMGRVPDGIRNALIAAADVVVIPSEEEGFGAPVIEAMVLETPVVCNRIPALVEVGGDAAVFVDADAHSIAEGIQTAVSAGDHYRELGRRRAQDFTLKASGQALRQAYLRAVSNS